MFRIPNSVKDFWNTTRAYMAHEDPPPPIAVQRELGPIKRQAQQIFMEGGFNRIRVRFVYSDELNQWQLGLVGNYPINKLNEFKATLDRAREITNYNSFVFSDTVTVSS